MQNGKHNYIFNDDDNYYHNFAYSVAKKVLVNPSIPKIQLMECSWTISGRNFVFIFIFFLLCSGPHLWHLEVPRLGTDSEL